MNIDERVRTLLLPVFGLESIDNIRSSQSLVRDLGAESLDFVEIVFLIEKEFGVKLETREIVTGGTQEGIDRIFQEGRLSAEGCAIIRNRLPDNPDRFFEGMSKMNIFESITVKDLVHIISIKSGNAHVAQ
jgi:acyl carrier protein